LLLNLREYHRPTSTAEAVGLLRRGAGRTAVLAGGTELAGCHDGAIESVVDLRHLPLAAIATGPDGVVTVGAMVTLKQLASTPVLQSPAGSILARAAERAAPATIRAAATLGGTLASRKGGDEVPTVLLALGAAVCLEGDSGPQAFPLAEFLARREELLEGALITGVQLPHRPGARGGFALVSRTPADRAIVCAAAVVTTDESTVAVGGLAPHPRLLGDIARWEVVSDHRGSAEYRRWVAPVLVKRALNEANGGNAG
jgi:CO/xanthine dehydrogenase FAD-binding subunit